MTNKTVRPIMTVEARDVLDKIHENMKCDDRSKSIVKYFDMRKSLYKEKISCRSEASRWKLISIITSTAFFALLAVTIFNAS